MEKCDLVVRVPTRFAVGVALVAIPWLVLVVGFALVWTCDYDCWDHGGGVAVFTAFMTAPGAILGALLLAGRSGKVMRLGMMVATVTYAVAGVAYVWIAWQLGASFLAVAMLCGVGLRLPPLKSREPAH